MTKEEHSVYAIKFYTMQKQIDDLEKENKILRENAEHNDKVVDKVNWEINILKHNRDKAIEELEYYKLVSSIHEEKNIQNIIDKLKGDSDE